MLINILVGSLMILVTTAIHAEGMILAMHFVQRHSKDRDTPRERTYLIAGVILLMFLTSLLEVTTWALTYLMLNAVEGFEKALYFSTVTFTTLGYGDVLLDQHWRLLSSFEAANGIIMFGWSTAIVVAAVQSIYSRTSHEKS